MLNEIVCGDCLRVSKGIPGETIDLVFTNPPTWRYKWYAKKSAKFEGFIGWEKNPEDYVRHMGDISGEIYRVLKSTGNYLLTIWNTDYHSIDYEGLSHLGWASKDQLLLLSERVAAMLQQQDWFTRNQIIWDKYPMRPSHPQGRVKHTHQSIYHFTKVPEGYYFKPLEGGRLNPNMRGSIWNFRYPKRVVEEFTTFPEGLCERIIDMFCPEGGVVFDPFCGAGTLPKVAKKMGRSYLGIELVPSYAEIAKEEVEKIPKPLKEVLK